MASSKCLPDTPMKPLEKGYRSFGKLKPRETILACSNGASTKDLGEMIKLRYGKEIASPAKKEEGSMDHKNIGSCQLEARMLVAIIAKSLENEDDPKSLPLMSIKTISAS